MAITADTQPDSGGVDLSADNLAALEAMRIAVADSASLCTSLWISYIFVLFYLLVGAASVTQRDLFLENPVQLPFLSSVALPLRGFFWFGPILFLIVHIYILLHFSMLAKTIGYFNEKLYIVYPKKKEGRQRTEVRRRLPNNIFVQFLAGPKTLRHGAFGFLLRMITWISLSIGPIFLLIFFQLQFLAFHEAWITWVQRMVVSLDLVLLWIIWPAAVDGRIIDARSPTRQKATVTAMSGLSVVAIFMSFIVASFPGEPLEAFFWDLPPFSWVRTPLVHGDVNLADGRRSSLWTDTIVLPNFDVIDHTRFSTDADFANVQSTYSVRGRNLQFAYFVNDNFQKVDFTGSDLTYATFDQSDLREADFCIQSLDYLADVAQAATGTTPAEGIVGVQDYKWSSAPADHRQPCADLEHASFVQAKLQGAKFDGVNLAHASFAWAHLEAASFIGANLTSSQFQYADLQDANLSSAHLDGAILSRASLQGALLSSTTLNRALLVGAQLQGTILYRAGLQDASLDGAQLQGATLNNTNLKGASMKAADFSYGLMPSVEPVETQKFLLTHYPPVTEQIYEMQTEKTWQQIGCYDDGRPYVMIDLIKRLQNRGSFPAASHAPAVLAVAFLKDSCQGNRGISDLDRANLEAIQAGAP